MKVKPPFRFLWDNRFHVGYMEAFAFNSYSVVVGRWERMCRIGRPNAFEYVVSWWRTWYSY